MNYTYLSAEEAAAIIQNDYTVGIGGFSSVGTPKAVPQALAHRAEELHAQGKAELFLTLQRWRRLSFPRIRILHPVRCATSASRSTAHHDY